MSVTIRIQRCTCALSAQLPPSTFDVAVMAKARTRATASQPWHHMYHLYTCMPVYLLLRTSTSVYLYTLDTYTTVYLYNYINIQLYNYTAIQLHNYITT